MRFIYVLAGWEGIAADSRVLRDAITGPTDLKYLELPMEDDGSKGVRRRGVKLDGKLSRRVWSTAEEEALLECLREIVRMGWKSDNDFRTGYLGVLEQLLNKACSNSRLKADPHISSKIHVWKKTYGCINDMMGRSGFGWNETTNNIDTKDEIDPFGKTLRYKSFPYYAQWCEVFGKDRATGEWEIDPIVAPRNTGNSSRNDHSESVPVSPEYYVPTPDPSLYGDDSEFLNSFASAIEPVHVDRSETQRVSSRKRKMVASEIDDKFDKKFEAFVNVTDARLGDIAKRFGVEAEESKSRKQVWSFVDSIPDLTLEEKCVVFKKLVNNKADLDLFLSMSTVGKETFVKMLATGKV
ncbi:UNVERIFIED_CONTAM: hypothetical protein Slati_3817000 [Sesamum latifolium]|uniref:Myb/SANT-like domain-containing protein n=1 Tax=Sesamum latifolium TaxID=2727402 RepID=A0AAW2U5C8_9LAMI